MRPQDYFAISVFEADQTSTETLVRVESTSPQPLREHVESFARYFLREMHFAALQYEANEHLYGEENVPYVAYLFVRQSLYVGACCTRWREWSDREAGWSLDWIWIHPFARREGLLAAAWPRLRAEQGDFHVATPLSPPMESFLKKHGA